MRRGITCETEEYEVKQSTAGQPVPVNFKVKTASYYADSVRIEGLNINIGKELGPNTVSYTHLPLPTIYSV